MKALISTPLGLSTFQVFKRLCLSDRISKRIQYDKDSKAYMLFVNFLSSFCFIFCPRCKREFLFRNEQNLLRSLDRLGDCINFSPTITNTGNIEGYVYFRLEQSVVIGECDTPLYTLDINNSWELRKEHILENKLISIYAYKDPLKTGQSTRSLMLTNSDVSDFNISIRKTDRYQLYNNNVC